MSNVGLKGKESAWLSELNIRDTSYGFVKRIIFIVSAIERHFGQSLDLDKVQILDVGCGTGTLVSIPLAKLGLAVTGIDIHPESIEYAQSIAANYPNLLFECKPLEECQDGHYDVIICSEVLEHVSSYTEFFAQLVKKMRPNGILILTVPNGYGPSEFQRWIWRNIFEGTWLYRLLQSLYHRRKRRSSQIAFLNKESVHVNFFRRSQLEELFKRYNLNLEQYQGRTFLCGFLVNFLLSLPGLSTVNSWLGSVLPHWMVSGWMFVLSLPDAKNLQC
jgi:2-polyprenyl-3-methyl-5-hydroxy-6-metoxy-1,4-benzoquinol methylase